MAGRQAGWQADNIYNDLEPVHSSHTNYFLSLVLLLLRHKNKADKLLNKDFLIWYHSVSVHCKKKYYNPDILLCIKYWKSFEKINRNPRARWNNNSVFIHGEKRENTFFVALLDWWLANIPKTLIFKWNFSFPFLSLWLA